jgi:hypothetical protein
LFFSKYSTLYSNAIKSCSPNAEKQEPNPPQKPLPKLSYITGHYSSSPLGTLRLETISPLCKIAALQRSRPITHATADALGLFFIGSIATRLCSFFGKISHKTTLLKILTMEWHPSLKGERSEANLPKKRAEDATDQPNWFLNGVSQLFCFVLGEKQRLFFIPKL